MPDTPTILAKRIRRAREDKGLNQSALAKALSDEMPEFTVTNLYDTDYIIDHNHIVVLTGNRAPTVDELKSVCAMLNTRTVRATAPLASGVIEAAKEIAHEYYLNDADTKANLKGREEEVYTDIASIITRHINQARPAESVGWQSIESAPKDGTVIMLWWPYWRDRAVIGYGFSTGWQSDVKLSDDCPDPTHWMPLPEPPALAASSSTEGDTNG